MSGNNQQDHSWLFAIGLIGAGFFIVAAFVYALILFVVGIVTAACVLAVFYPIRIGRLRIESDNAFHFLGRGCCGVFLFGAFAIFLAWFYALRITDDIFGHILLVGYVAGAVGPELWGWVPDEKSAIVLLEEDEVYPPPPVLLPPPPAPAPSRLPVRFVPGQDTNSEAFAKSFFDPPKTSSSQPALPPGPPLGRFASWDDEAELPR